MAGRLFRAGLALGLALLATATAPVRAQTYPERAVRIISPYPPGGSVDLMARVLAAKLAEVWGSSVIVENRSGAGGYHLVFDNAGLLPFYAGNPRNPETSQGRTA